MNPWFYLVPMFMIWSLYHMICKFVMFPYVSFLWSKSPEVPAVVSSLWAIGPWGRGPQRCCRRGTGSPGPPRSLRFTPNGWVSHPPRISDRVTLGYHGVMDEDLAIVKVSVQLRYVLYNLYIEDSRWKYRWNPWLSMKSLKVIQYSYIYVYIYNVCIYIM